MTNNRKKEITHIYISYTSHKYLEFSMAYVELTVKSTLQNTVPGLTDPAV